MDFKRALSNRSLTYYFYFSTTLPKSFDLKNLYYIAVAKQLELCPCVVSQGIKLTDFPLEGSPNQKICRKSENICFVARFEFKVNHTGYIKKMVSLAKSWQKAFDNTFTTLIIWLFIPLNKGMNNETINVVKVIFKILLLTFNLGHLFL